MDERPSRDDTRDHQRNGAQSLEPRGPAEEQPPHDDREAGDDGGHHRERKDLGHERADQGGQHEEARRGQARPQPQPHARRGLVRFHDGHVPILLFRAERLHDVHARARAAGQSEAATAARARERSSPWRGSRRWSSGGLAMDVDNLLP
jgi:hypothetical protein